MVVSTTERTSKENWLYKLIGILLGLYLLVSVLVGIYWSYEPKAFSVTSVEQQYMTRLGKSSMVGSTTTATALEIAHQLLNKPGGYIHNDRFPPGLWLDNIGSWEQGVVIQLRDFSRAMRKDFSRSQSQSTEDSDLKEAEPNFNFDTNSWLLPSTESKYQEGYQRLQAYLARLVDPENETAQFYARADNLAQWLKDVETRLGSLSQRLSASVGQKRINTDVTEDGVTSTTDEVEFEVKTPWLEIDDVFYETRGTAWALIHLLKAVEVDFVEVLRKKNALVSLRQIIRELEETQQRLWSPMVLNGGGFGVFANHSLVMASYVSRAHAAIIDLRSLLSQG
jgi:hypothetical protein